MSFLEKIKAASFFGKKFDAENVLPLGIDLDADCVPKKIGLAPEFLARGPILFRKMAKIKDARAR
jgi:hypothetical protein